MKILIIDDHPAYIGGLKTVLESMFGSLVLYETAHFEEAMKVVDSNKLDLILVDYKIPGADGFDFLKAFLARSVVAPIAMISGENEAFVAKKALDSGACGFIPKNLKTEQLISALRTVLNGEEFLTQEMYQRVQQLSRREYAGFVSGKAVIKQAITPRQLEVLKLMSKGYPNKRIANILNVSVDTIKEHIHNIFRTLEVENRSQCIFRAQELNIEIKD